MWRSRSTASVRRTPVPPGSNGSLAEAFDAYAALDWLAQQNSVDPDRIAVLGFSMRGIAGVNTVEAGVGAIERAKKRHFRAAVTVA
jgi:dienelactone hydrolase